ncbi:TIGR03617 family F420-dependent LLM class oxidoreductase [Salinibacterium sp. SWN167]|uniref:TIGR03617 family F420-dependent LLM class oxidoreductase n=1 Tax=Salinibacterium sp. SWN167 TaxID=2792054 RepID=UPI0018CCAC4D|nr:TIGR03617 family F420-dependent LLM class oxidoreductase [Salinibacterium sp. SWN167]MBH0082299.1 TIGR03617 family F420-dependent LLM class oxidoreductase [Salinibacterium sp. SWN167]
MRQRDDHRGLISESDESGRSNALKVDTHLSDLGHTAESTLLAQQLGFDGIFAAEVTGDPFVACAVSSQYSGDMDLGTKIAVAFARTPMTLAYAAHELGELTAGRFHLGLGTQIRAHITRRFSMPWSKPTARMREFVLATTAIWDSWREDTPLAFSGEFYEHSLMTEYFVPHTRTPAPPPIWLAAVGPRMAEVSAEVGDGIVLHGFWTRGYLDAVMMPAIERGLAAGGRKRDDFTITAGGFLVTGATEEELVKNREQVRYQVAFYGSTRSYRPVWEAHDLGDLGDRLHALSVEKSKDRWSRMTKLIGDDVLELFAVEAEPQEVGSAMLARHGDYADRISLPHLVGDPDVWAKTIATIKAGDTTPTGAV